LAAPAFRPAAPEGAVVLDYALVGDTLLAWGLGRGTPRLVRATVDRDRLAARLEQLNVQLERGDAEAVVRPELERLFELLVRPFADRLGAEGSPVVIVADGELGGVPFTALFDRAAARYLVDAHVVRYASSLADAAIRARPSAPPADVTIAANPAYDAHAYPGLERLGWAAAEGDSIRRFYRRSALLSETAATRAGVMSALRDAQVFHFSGHALFDPAQPERSSLVLAPERGARGPRPLTAADLDTMDLHGTRLVVLSACETLRASAGRGSAFAGFAAAFLGAGAGGVVGGSWRVDDATSMRLMTAFHHAYRGSGDGAAALRTAQRTLLHSGNPELSSPSAWAAFRYAGN
jgi:CHAT domain-containing protein